MTSEVPAHLARQQPAGPSVDEIGLVVLSRLTEDSFSTLSVALADSWIGELDNAISDTKHEIAGIVQSLGDDFPRQLTLALSLPSRLDAFEQRALELAYLVHSPKSGILPTLTETFDAHDVLVQEGNSRKIANIASAFLNGCSTTFYESRQLEASGSLVEAAQKCRALALTTLNSPEPLGTTSAFLSLKKDIRALHDKIHEELGMIIEQCISLDSQELQIREHISYNHSSKVLHLGPVFETMEPTSLELYLSGFRKRLVEKFLQPVIHQGFGVVSPPSESPCRLILVEPSQESPDVFESLSSLLTYLSQSLFHHLPQSQREKFPGTLYGPIFNSLLEYKIIAALPSDIGGVDLFLARLTKAVHFEDEAAELGIRGGRKVREWASSMDSRYERTRAQLELERARKLILSPLGAPSVLQTEVETLFDEEEAKPDPPMTSETGWGFDDSVDEGDAWGFDEDGKEVPATRPEAGNDGWGWEDESDEDTPASGRQPDLIDSERNERSGRSSLKAATRLEKLSKGKSLISDQRAILHNLPETRAPDDVSTKVDIDSQPTARQTKTKSKQRYQVSSRAILLSAHIRTVLQEAQLTEASQSFDSPLIQKKRRRGDLLIQAALGSLDLLRSQYILYSDFSVEDMQWTSDFMYLAQEARTMEPRLRQVNGEMAENWSSAAVGLEKFRELAREEVALREISRLEQRLPPTTFSEVSNEIGYQEALQVLRQTSERVRGTAKIWERIMIKDDYLVAVGAVVDALLAKVVSSILSLADITEVESRRLADLCRILEPLQDLFPQIESAGSSIGAYVPSWFRYEYLGELLVASIADISYLFDEGMLVDYESGEIVGLLRALFSETPLRESTIRRIEQSRLAQTQ